MAANTKPRPVDADVTISLAEYLHDFPADHAAYTIAQGWLKTLLDTMRETPRGTMRAWFERHNGQTVDTLQATITDNGDVRDAWAPNGRKISATRAGRVALDESVRDYAGCRVVHVSETALIIATNWGDSARQIAAYRISA